MKRLLTRIVAALSMCVSLGALGQQAPPVAPTPPKDSALPVRPMSKREMMKNCMAREAAKNDGSSRAQLKKSCRREVKQNMVVEDMMKK